MIIRFIIYWLALFIFFGTRWALNNFIDTPLESLIFQLYFTKHAIGSIPNYFIETFVKQCIAIPIILAIEIIIIERFLYIIKSYCLAKINQRVRKKFLVFSLLDKFLIKNSHILLLLLAIMCFNEKFSIPYYVLGQLERVAFSPDYISVKNLNIRTDNPKNLVLIYMESVEDSYKRTDLFGKNLLASLYNNQGISFNKYKQVPGTGWTIAGIFATQCGNYINASFATAAYVCLSDILERQGYYNVFMGGTSLEFTKKGEFFKNHKYHELYGREEWLKKGIKDMNEWGSYDEDIFKEAKIRIKSLHSSGSPFNLTILTGDTHAPNGYISKYCAENFGSSIYNVVECSANQVADFIEFIKQSGYLEDTNIVVVGDHLFPIDKNIANKSKSKRYIFNRFIANKMPIKNRENITHFDLFPSILEFMEFKVKDGRLGIGKSAFHAD